MENDAILAQNIVRHNGSNINGLDTFHTNSFIYKKTNERLQDITDHLFNNTSILSVIGSGDQIINAMITSPKEIKAFDISRFPSYFLRLKLAAIQSLSRYEFIKMFFEDTLVKLDDYYDELYFTKIRNYLSNEDKDFWDFLFNFNDWSEIYNSSLFSSEVVSFKYALEQNSYLDTENYEKLKTIIPNVDISYEVTSLENLEVDKIYDLIYLSNIIAYVDVKEYKEKVLKLLKNCKKEIITYIFSSSNEASKYFEDTNTESISLSENSVLIHRN